jgi:hypothetical protein
MSEIRLNYEQETSPEEVLATLELPAQHVQAELGTGGQGWEFADFVGWLHPLYNRQARLLERTISHEYDTGEGRNPCGVRVHFLSSDKLKRKK